MKFLHRSTSCSCCCCCCSIGIELLLLLLLLVSTLTASSFVIPTVTTSSTFKSRGGIASPRIISSNNNDHHRSINTIIDSSTLQRQQSQHHHHQQQQRHLFHFNFGFVLKATKKDDECLVEDTPEECLLRSGYDELEECSYASITKVYVATIERLGDRFPPYESKETTKEGSNMIKYNKRRRRQQQQHANDQNTVVTTAAAAASSASSYNSHIANLEYNCVVGEDDIVLVDTIRTPETELKKPCTSLPYISRAFPRAGPREFLHFDPSKVNAAIITCGGLCPGLNNVIRELVHTLHYMYGVDKVWGVVGGFQGFHNPDFQPIELTNDLVENIHHEGGTLLRSSRGGFDIDKILQFFQAKNINQLYVIGGDGTHRGAYKIHQACQEAGLNVAVAGIPKTIDNDVDYIDRSFGFQSAVEAAQASIRTAKVEASCTIPNAVSVVKLMGRSAGFLASFAALGSGDVDAVLIPEVPIVLEGPGGILPFIRQRVKEQNYAVVVVAEGAGEELLGESTIVDKGGNKALPPIGEYMKTQIAEHFKKHGEDATVRYIDPSYTVRSVPANAADSLYCMQLAQNAVHGAMAGLTGFATGLINNQPVYVPIPKLVSTSPRSMDPFGQTWEQILAMTGQPNTVQLLEEEDDEDKTGELLEEMRFPEPTLH